MTRVEWDRPDERYFETGLDRGMIYPKVGEGVPWSGLTAVDEDGADSASEFYMDGRPFLYLPRPKEFKASLKAYTFPDEFSELMGTYEITDGMYIDSQLGDSFGLCYRTLIGSATKETHAAYKIHVIYNATMSPQGSSYTTASDSISLSEFSWEIRAVPVAVTGYRAAAHVTIDTRHLDATRLSALEVMLYGDESTAPSLPSIDVLYELLNFGEGIIVTDNGDGTFTVEGAYTNVYLTNPSTFVVENVTAVDHGDGTFDISTTTP